MCANTLILLLATITFSTIVFGANILYISAIASKSHHIWNRALALGLIEKGHNLTMLSHDKDKNPPENFTVIVLEGIYDDAHFEWTVDSVAELSPWDCIKTMYTWTYANCAYDFTTQGLKQLLNYPKDYKFDLIIYDVTFSQCLYPIIDRFHKPPVVGVTPFLLPPILSDTFGNPLQTAYMPYFSTVYGDKMTFTERLWNAFYIYLEVLYRKYIALPNEEKLARKHFNFTFRPLEEIERSITLLLANVDPILGYPLDLPPNIIPVGGLQVAPAKPLPKDLQTILDESKDGIILFTLGSNLLSSDLSEDKKNALLMAFSKLRQTVVWKFETDNHVDLPKNVIIRKWLPQSDILGHPNTKIFITHGGGLGSHEAMYHGVPSIGIPFCADHVANVGKIVRRKVGLMLPYNNITTENVFNTIKEILQNPTYTDNIKLLSKRYRDQPQTPLARAVFWVEYMIRHGSAEHLNLAARDMSIYQVLLLDTWFVLVLLSLLIYLSVMFVLTKLRLLWSKDAKKVKQT